MSATRLELPEKTVTTNKSHRPRINDTVHHNELHDVVADHHFIAPFEICAAGIGPLSILLNRHIIDASFSKLYQQSLKLGWEKIFIQERQKLKPNDISVMKCFVLNRLLNQYLKDPHEFAQKTKCLYEEIRSRLSTDFPQWTSQDLFKEVKRWQDMQCRRRLFCFIHEELIQLPGLLMLQKAATNWCHCLINHCQQNQKFWETEGVRRFTEHFQHSFIIVAQPTGSEGAAATQYIKSPSGHFAKLNARIICLLDPVILKDYIELTDIDVILYPLNRETNDKKEQQPAIKWQIRKVMSTEGIFVPVYYAEVHTLQLGKNDSECKRLTLNSTLCQIEFRWKIKVRKPEYEQTIVFTTQPFGICSHAQYFPKFVAQIFLYEMKQILNNQSPLTDPDIITVFIRRYYTRMTGFELTDHTNRYIREVFAEAIDDVKSNRTINTLDNLHEDLLAKMISQMDYLSLHQVLTLMYDDSLFLGICNSAEVDRMLSGTRYQPHLLLRFNTLTNHQWNANATVQCVIHDGTLRRTSIDTKTFANETCRLICESISKETKQAIVLSIMAPRRFADFGLYFHEELYRLNKMSPPSSDAYDPLLPILWMTMRHNDDNNVATTDVVSRNTTPKKKRNYSDSFPTIESVSSESEPIPINIIVHINNVDDVPSSSYRSSIDFHCSIIPNSTTAQSLSIVEKDGQMNNQTGARKKRQWLIEMPDDIDISPAVVFRYLGEQLSATDHQENDLSGDFFIRPQQMRIPLSNLDSSRRPKSSVDHSSDNSNSSSSEISKIGFDSSADVRPDDTLDHIKIKEEPHDVDYAILTNGMTL